MTTCREILAWCDDILQTAQFKDYAPNGLQVEGAEKIEKIVAAVTASRAAVGPLGMGLLYDVSGSWSASLSVLSVLMLAECVLAWFAARPDIIR